jgi:hypothetical protein
MADFSDLFERVREHLRSLDPRNGGDLADGILEVFESDGPRRLTYGTTPAALAVHLAALAEESGDVLWPEASSTTAAIRLLSMHLDEHVGWTFFREAEFGERVQESYRITASGIE